MATSTADNRQFDSELRQTELGNVVADNKNLIIAILILFIIGAAGFGFYRQNLVEQNKEVAQKVFALETTTLKDFKDGKMEATQFLSAFNSTLGSHKSLTVYTAAALGAFDALAQKGNFKEGLSLIKDLVGTNTYQNYALTTRKAVALENNGDFSGAIAALSLINSKDYESVKGKVNLDLGRLSVLSGDKAQAKTYFEEVLKANAQKEFKSLASYYLGQL